MRRIAPFAERLRLPERLMLMSLVVCSTSLVCTGTAMEPPMIDPDRTYPNLRLPTLGGKQLWTDHRWLDDYRLQQNALSGHWRVLDPDNVRIGWGGKTACLRLLQQQPDATTGQTAATGRTPADHVVLLIHGLGRTGSCMQSLAAEIEQADLGRPIIFSYASGRAAVADHAAALREFTEHLPNNPRICVVAHSLGNIVLRHAIHDWQNDGDPHGVLDRLDACMMLGPPNQGSRVAERLSRLGLFKLATGQSGQQLGARWDLLEEQLATPPCPFGIVAGDLSHWPLSNPLLEGPNDLLVTLEEAQLPGALFLEQLPVPHTVLMSHPAAVQRTIDFLKQHQPHRGQPAIEPHAP
jgi:hypothetical protein